MTDTTITGCLFCGKSHGLRCPEVKSIEYFEGGQRIKKVEFMTPADYHAPLGLPTLGGGQVTFGGPGSIMGHNGQN